MFNWKWEIEQPNLIRFLTEKQKILSHLNALEYSRNTVVIWEQLLSIVIVIVNAVATT